MPPPRRTYRMPRPTPRTLRGEVIGRTALAILGLIFLVGAYKCVHTAISIQRDYDQRYDRISRNHNSGAGAPLAIGGVLFLLGAPLLFAALVPVSAVEKLLGRQTNNTLYENPSASSYLRDMDGPL